MTLRALALILVHVGQLILTSRILGSVVALLDGNDASLLLELLGQAAAR